MRAVILANGDLPDPEAARHHIQGADRLICANGGTRHAAQLGLIPDVVVGDLDSVDPSTRTRLAAAGVRFEAHPVRKSKTDLELALGLAVAEGAEHVDLLATLGGRLDQSLANLLLLAQPEWAAVSVRVIEGREMAWVVRGGQTTQVAGTAGNTLSLVPLTPQVTGVTLTGVEWPLVDATLQLGSTWTISNTLADRAAQLQVAGGLVLVVLCS